MDPEESGRPLTEREVEEEVTRTRKARNKLATRICVMANDEERARMVPRPGTPIEEVIAWAAAEAESPDPVQVAGVWRAATSAPAAVGVGAGAAVIRARVARNPEELAILRRVGFVAATVSSPSTDSGDNLVVVLDEFGGFRMVPESSGSRSVVGIKEQKTEMPRWRVSFSTVLNKSRRYEGSVFLRLEALRVVLLDDSGIVIDARCLREEGQIGSGTVIEFPCHIAEVGGGHGRSMRREAISDVASARDAAGRWEAALRLFSGERRRW